MKHLLQLLLGLLAALALTTFAAAAEPEKPEPAVDPAAELSLCITVDEPTAEPPRNGIEQTFVANREASAEKTAEVPVKRAPVPPEMARRTARLERLWLARVEDEDCRFTVRITDCGTLVLEQTGAGVLDCAWRFDHTDWTGFRCFSGETGTEGGVSESRAFDPFGDGALLRVRCFLFREDGRLQICQTATITGRDGALLHRSVSIRDVDPEQRDFTYSFESFSAEAEPSAPEPSVISVSLQTAPAARTRTRTWTYTSSDGRPLWAVTLTGVFAEGRCVEASGAVTLLDEGWDCETAVFTPVGPEAAARVLMRRKILSVPVAEREYEFLLSSAD